MPRATANVYTTYEFETPEEAKVAQTFNHLQKMYLANMRYEVMVERDNLVVNFAHPEDYFYKKAQMDGQIDALTVLIDIDVEEEVNQQSLL